MEKRKNKTRLARAAMTLLVMLCFLGGARAQQALPYEYGFENNDLAADGWTTLNATSTNTGINSAALHSGDYAFRFHFSEQNDASLISPVLTGGDNGIDVSFWYRNFSSSYDEQFYVGYTTDENVTGPDDFTYGDIITASTSWQQYENSFPAGTKRIAIKYVYNDAFYLFLDDFSFEAVGSCPKPRNLEVTLGDGTATATWTSDASSFNIDINGTVTTNVTNPYTFNTELSTTYTVKVQANCDGSETSNWSDAYTFTTPSCWASDMCSITLALTDSYGDGWNGGKMEVVDATTGEIYGTYTIESGGSATYELPLCPGTVVNFVYTAGKYGTENGWVIYDPAGEVITEEAGCNDGCTHNNGIQATYTMNCSGCFKPSSLTETNVSFTSATLNWNGNNDSYVLQYRPWNPAGDDIITTGEMVTYTVDLSQYEGTGSVAIRHYDISDMFQLIVDNIEVTNAAGTVVYSQDFEDCGGNMPAEFSNMDLDGDGSMWEIASSPSSNVDGSYGIVSASYDNYAGALTPDNWLILSGIEMGGQMTFQARGQDPAYAAENFAIYVSTENSIVEVPVTATTYNATDLTPNTPYAWQVKGVCSEVNESRFVSSFFKTKDDMLVFATDGNWNDVANWKDAEGNTATALPTNVNNVRIDAAAVIPAGYVACANKATIGTGSITIKDGGQLKQNAATLRVTMEKEIADYGENDGNYYFIASPFNGRTLYSESGSFSIVNNMLTDEYDLNAFDAAASDGLEWINYKSEPQTHNAFIAENGLAGLLYSEGYLYANQEGTTLEFIGTTGKSNNYSESRDFTYDDSSSDVFNGWKLIGNPFTCNGYVTYSGDGTFYKRNGDGLEAFENGVVLAPGEGAFMKVSASGTITYSSEAPEGFTSTSTTAAGILPILPLHGLTTNVDANGEDILFAKEGYATYYNGEYDVVLPAGMKAHVVTDGSTNLTYAGVADGDTDGNVVPKGTAVLLQVEPSTEDQTLPVYLVTPSADPYAGTNLLFGSDDETTTTGGAKYYKLTYSNDNANFGWYWGADNGAAFTSPAHKAWLALPASSAPFLGLPGWEDTTGIVPVGVDSENGEWYTLQGLKIGKKPTTKDVYIHNGRKVVIK